MRVLSLILINDGVLCDCATECRLVSRKYTFEFLPVVHLFVHKINQHRIHVEQILINRHVLIFFVVCILII